MASLVMAFAASVAYGFSDFFGGIASRASDVYRVTAASQFFGLMLLLSVAPFFGDQYWSASDAFLGAAAGFVMLFGILGLYQGLAIGPMHLVAPIASVAAAMVPLIWGLAAGERPEAIALSGLLLAMIGTILLVTGPTNIQIFKLAISGLALALAIGSGISIGLFYVLLSYTDGQSALWPLVFARVVTCALIGVILLLVSSRTALRPMTWRLPLWIGLCDAIAGSLYIISAHSGPLVIVGPITSLCPPVTTTILAMFVIGERAKKLQLIGLGTVFMGLALVGIAQV